MVPDSGNSSPEKINVTSPRSFCNGIGSANDPRKATQPVYTPREPSIQVPLTKKASWQRVPSMPNSCFSACSRGILLIKPTRPGMNVFLNSHSAAQYITYTGKVRPSTELSVGAGG